MSPKSTQSEHFPLFARILHWALAICVIANLWLTEEETLTHENVGIVAFAAVAIRLVFIPLLGAPKISLRLADWKHHLFELKQRELRGRYNPAAACMIWLLWIWVLLTALSGYLGYHYLWAYSLMQVHEFLAETLEYIVLVHLGAILILSVHTKNNLVRRMLFK